MCWDAFLDGAEASCDAKNLSVTFDCSCIEKHWPQKRKINAKIVREQWAFNIVKGFFTTKHFCQRSNAITVASFFAMLD